MERTCGGMQDLAALLPIEVWEGVFSWLGTAHDLCAVASVCRASYDLVAGPQASARLWRSLALQRAWPQDVRGPAEYRREVERRVCGGLSEQGVGEAPPGGASLTFSQVNEVFHLHSGNLTDIWQYLFHNATESWQSADVVLYNYITQFTDEQLLHAIVKAALPSEAPSVDWWIVWRRTLHSSRLANTLARWVLLRPHITRTGNALDLMCAHLASPSTASLLGFVRASDLELLVSVTKQLAQQQHRLECPEVNSPGSPPEDQATETLLDLSSPSGDRHHVVREFLSTPPEHVAAELTARHWSLFSSIAISELFESGGFSNLKGKAPTVARMIAEFSQLVWAVVGSIVQPDSSPQERAAVVQHWIREVRKHNNFNGLLNVLAGLNTSSVARLKQTWEVVRADAATRAAYEELGELMSRARGFQRYRRTLEQAKQPCIPYAGMILSDMTFINDSTNRLPDPESVPFSRWRECAKVFAELRKWQSVPYHFTVEQRPPAGVALVYRMLTELAGLEEAQAYRLSLARELLEAYRAFGLPADCTLISHGRATEVWVDGPQELVVAAVLIGLCWLCSPIKGDRLALCGKLWAACLVLLVSATATQAACPWTTYDQTFASWRATATPDQEGAYRVTGVRLLMQGPTVDLSAYSLKLYNNGVIVFADQSVTLSVNNIIIESGGALIVGNEECPYTRQAVIRMTGLPTDPGLSSPTGQYSTSQLGPAGNNNTSPYGNRVIAVGAGGTLSLRGSKGVGRLGGVSWTHLATTAESPTTIMTFTSAVDWVGGDKVVMATSDFEPEHSEEVTISTTTLQGWVGYMLPPPRYSHFGERLDYSRSVDIRSEVALLTRNIRIESAPNSVNPSYGAHTIFRRGFTSVQVEGVEFADLGQGGFIMRYPIHFHMVVDAAPNTFVRDCSINRSWNRWVVLHGTRRVTIQRNVGYMSYGHGFYLEDGYETNNIFDANIGITAKPAMQNAFWNPNNVPSIIESDQSTPSIFWITNAYNTFTNNAAVGATACGRCYWFVGRNGNGPSAEVPELANAPFANGQRAPIYKFKGNSAHACFLGIDTIPPLNAGNDCATVVSAGVLKPLPHNTPDSSWRSDQTGFTFITPTVDGGVNDNYAIGIIDSATVYRNRGSPLYSAVWLRPYWWWMRNSAILDNNMGGVTMVSGGDPSGVVEGYWGASTNTIYVGFSKWGDQWMPYGNNTDGVNERPFNPETGSTYPGGLFAERRGHQFYDGPAHISKCEFHSFNPRLSSPRVNAPITGAHVVRNNTAIGWFMPNVFLYPAAFTSEHLLFNDTSIRHFVVGPRIAEAFFFPTPEAVLRDGDKQTFLHDLDGTLTGFADSTSINNYEFHRGPVWQVECLSAETCITSPYSYVNAHVIVQDVAPRTITATRAWDNAQSPLPNLIGIQTNNVRQWFLLAMKSGSYHLDFAPPLPSSLPLFVRLMYSYATNDYVEFSICANGLNPALMTVQYGQMTNHYNGDPAAAFTASAANPVEWAYDPAVGRLTVKVVNHQPKNDHCYPSGACKLNQATGKCVYNAAVASVTNCADNIAECDEVCAKYGNTYPECPEGGCPTVRIDFGHQSSATATCTGRPQRCLGSQLAGVRLQGTDVDVDPAQPSQCTGQCDSTIHYDPPPSGCAWSSGGTCDAAP